MKSLFTLMILACTMNLMAQVNTYQSAADTDPVAKKIIQDLRTEYEGYQSLKVVFDFTMDLPEQDAEVESGYMIQKGDLYKLDMASQAMYNDGKDLYLHLKRNNEVQISDLDEDAENMMSPKDILSSFDNEEYVYAVVGEKNIDGINQTIIDFKPLSEDSEYSKMSIYVTSSKKELKKIYILARDGSRFVLDVKDILPNVTISDSEFTFDSSQYPEIYIEDLRID